jgi:RNA polymerase-associated protein
MTLYHADSCPYCVRSRLVLAGKELAYESVQVDLTNRPALLHELNPRNKVPVLVDADVVLSESEAIDEYLDEVYPQDSMMPENPADRARVRMMMRRFDDFAAAYYALRRGEHGAELEVLQQLNALDVQLALAPYIAGETYSLADPGYWPWVSRLPRYGVDPREYAAVAAWLDRLEERPEYVAEMAVAG